jgi:hypothetical protein
VLRWTANLLACLLFLLAVGAGVFWYRSYARQDVLTYYGRHGADSVFARRGSFTWFNLKFDVPAPPDAKLEWRPMSRPLTAKGDNKADHPTKSFLGFGLGESTAEGYRFVSIPCWSAVTVLLLFPAVRVTWVVVRRKRRRAGACLTCGYDLRASAGRCPECGTPIP